MIEGSGSVPCTNGGSGRPNNILIRIRNNDWHTLILGPAISGLDQGIIVSGTESERLYLQRNGKLTYSILPTQRIPYSYCLVGTYHTFSLRSMA
jgi:hypothetical protein